MRRPEFFSNGTKLLGAPGLHAKVTPGAIEELASRRTDIHYPKPRVVSLTQSTEQGTVYKLDELAAIHQMTKRFKLATHMDGARFANAIATLVSRRKPPRGRPALMCSASGNQKWHGEQRSGDFL